MHISKKSPTAKRSSTATNYYLLFYNTLSCIGWGYVLIMTFIHLVDLPLPKIFNPATGGLSPFQAIHGHVRGLVHGLVREAQGLLMKYHKSFIIAMMPPQLLEIYFRMTTTYDVVGRAVAIVQTTAALEIVHAIFGLVRSPLPTTIIQVYSRLFLVWGITQKYEQSRHSVLYSTMILAWSTTEVIRYAFYALSLARGTVPGFLVYLRYTTFYVLYPLGASSEALLILSSLPNGSPLSGLKDGSWNIWDYFRGLMFVAWWPGLLAMMWHMVKQRRKVYRRGEGTKLKSS